MHFVYQEKENYFIILFGLMKCNALRGLENKKIDETDYSGEIFNKILLHTIRCCVYIHASYETYHLQYSHLILRYRALSTVKRPSRNSRQIAILVHEAVILRKISMVIQSFILNVREITMPLFARQRSRKIVDK